MRRSPPVRPVRFCLGYRVVLVLLILASVLLWIRESVRRDVAGRTGRPGLTGWDEAERE